MNTNQVVALALAARTRADVDRLEEALREALPGADYRFVDDRPGNWSSVNSGAEPTALLFERVTNMFDALIEHRARDRTAPSWQSPAEAVADLYDAPEGVDGMSPADRARLAQDAVVTLLDSDEPKQTPTITFRDRGTGLTGEQMPSTILSLAQSPKLGNWWAHGVFGKGGTTASQYSDATIIVTRRQPELLAAGAPDMVSVAVMKKDKAPGYRMRFFHYLVDEQQRVFSVPADEVEDFPPGTYIAHINYHLGAAGVQNWVYDQSIYSYAESVLFRPVLPYGLLDARSGDANTRPDDRLGKASTLAGLGRRLDNRKAGTIIDHGDLGTVTVPGVGVVRPRWWLFQDTSARRKMAARGYSLLFVSNGQTHQTWDQQRLQSLIPDRRRVCAQLLVEVDCDAIDVETRVELFTSDRNAMRNSPEGKALQDQVVEAISADPTLKEHEDDFVRKALKVGAKGVNEAFLSRMNRAIKMKSPGLKMERGGGMGATTHTRPPAPVPLLYPEPTYLEGPEKVLALRGKTARVYLKANAVDGFVPDRATLAVTPEADAPPLTPNIGSLRNGRLAIGLQVPADAETGTYMVTFAITWTDDRGAERHLDWDTKVEVVTEIKPKDTGSRQKPGSRGDVAFMWSKTEHEEGWTNNTAGNLQFPSGAILAEKNPKTYGHLKKVERVPTVVLNEDFKDWSAYRNTVVSKVGDKGLDLRTQRYGVAVGSAVADICGNEERLIRLKDSGRDVPEPMTEDQQQRAVTAAAREALVLLGDLDTVTGGGPDGDG